MSKYLKTTFKVAYKPNIPRELLSIILRKMYPVMSDTQSDSDLYSLEILEEICEDLTLSKESREFIKEMNNNNIEYIEL